ncbi:MULTISPECIES: type I polyketide synthase [Paenibacillus]|uniref:type I polyketide synthase n=1 Tax=Paenibacillus TaxID=44249 RepID=UPI0022B8883C|nr:type I polyketide synthase [Paenibacillus caseinilyticus]MCZ8519462.1 type I polyketide synthase [Paenibacillus caseinilyticus]
MPLEPIAIIGVGCRFPGGAHSPEQYWKLLTEGRDAVTEVPADRWSISSYYDPERSKHGKTVTKWGGFLDRIDEFDAGFFGMSPREASFLDPQQRLLLEVAMEAMEDGGQPLEQMAGSRTGVYIGGFTLDYKLLQFTESNRHLVDSHTATGAMMTLLSNRLSYVFDLRGPSVSVDTACSSSLVAVHLACQSLWCGESEMALAGGVNVMLKPEYTIAESKAGMLSPDGRSKAFDASANGYVRGEGAGIVLLKPLARALADGDPVYACIRGTAVNQDGHSSGLTVPRGEAQESLLVEAYAKAGITPDQIQYVEAHGTGTPVGDPIEVNALGRILSRSRDAASPCYIGSVKTNFGHTEAAAGIAGLIKTALSLRHRLIPPHLHLQQPNPQILFGEHLLQVPSTVTPWPAADGLALAGVNSFGFGGTNAHVVLEEAPAIAKRVVEEEEAGGIGLFPASARSKEALQALAASYAERIAEDRSSSGQPSLQDWCYTASLRRSHHRYRLSAVAGSWDELEAQLQAAAKGEAAAGLHMAAEGAQTAEPVFVFTGMGPQWWGMGQELYRTDAVFREAANQCDEAFRQAAGWSILEEMLKSEETSRMEETEIAQPANFVLQVALAAMLQARGIRPKAIVGHSAGEAAAAYVAGALDLEDAAALIYHRSRLQQMTTGQGRLAAVGLPQEEVLPRLAGFEDRVSFAAVNSPGSVTLVGEPQALERIVSSFEAEGVFCRYLRGKVPYHSHYMDPLRDELLASLSSLNPREEQVPLYSTVTGMRISGEELGAGYWWHNVRETVRFADAAAALIGEGHTVFIEIGPHPVLASSLQEGLRHLGKMGTSTATLRRGEEENRKVLEAIGAMYTTGVSLDWSSLHPLGGDCVSLPGYPWQRERHWQESPASEADRLGLECHPLLGKRLASPLPTWEKELNLTSLGYLRDHEIQSTIVYPGAAYVEMGMSAAREVYGDAVSGLAGEVRFRKALFIPAGMNVLLRLVLDPDKAEFQIYSTSRPDRQEWTLHAAGKLLAHVGMGPGVQHLPLLQARCTQEIDRERCYSHFRKLGLEYGPAFRGIHRLFQGGEEALAQVEIPSAIEPELEQYSIHPAVLDVGFQVLAAALPFRDEEAAAAVYMPTGVKQGTLYRSLRHKMWIHARITSQTDQSLYGDIRFLDEEGNVLMEILDCEARSLQEDTAQKWVKPQSFYEMKWNAAEPQADTPAREWPQQSNAWLVFADESGLGEDLAAAVRERGLTAVMLRPGDVFEKTASAEYRIDPRNPDHYEALLQMTLADGLRFQGMLHLWNLDAVRPEEADPQALHRSEVTGCHSVVYLIQALSKGLHRTAPKLWIVTRGAQAVGELPEPGSIQIAQAPVWGLGKVIGHQEHSEFWGGLIDLDPRSTDRSGDAGLLWNQVCRADREDLTAFRGEQRYTVRLELRADHVLPVPPAMRPDGAYLITGGLGGLGLVTAAWMAKQGARHLILMGRQPLPPRAEWSRIDPNSAAGQRIAAVREIELLGASVHTAAVDVTDSNALAAWMESYTAEQRPPIRGVLHTAGVARPKLLLHMTGEEFSDVMRPKAAGAWNLHRQFEGHALDFFILFSSIASVIVSTGQSNYSAGNTFLDALAQYRKSLGMPAVSINWGPWGDVGLATQLDLLEYFVKRGFYPMTPEQGLDALGFLMSRPDAQCTVIGADWPTVADFNYPLGQAPAMLEAVLARSGEEERTETDGRDAFRAEVLSLENRQERKALLESYLLELTASVLRIQSSKLATDQSMSFWGLDSMMAIELKGRIDSQLHISLTIVDLLKGPSISELADIIMELLEDGGSHTADAEEQQLMEELEKLTDGELTAMLQEVSAGGEPQ